nr:UvrD-helicase domain-containing protein [uncultured Solibaculum sp.]
MDYKLEWIKLRKTVLEQEFKRMNKMQRQAVFSTEGPLLILAGAGSGKTTVLVNRISNLIKYGSAYHSDQAPAGITERQMQNLRLASLGELAPEKMAELVPLLAVDPPKPWQILAITFTNKAAKELTDRLDAMLGSDVGKDVWASTFHATCARMLRRDADKVGYTSHFTIRDTDDTRRLMKECYKALNIDDKVLPVRSTLSEISRAKDQMMGPGMYLAMAGDDNRKKKIAQAYSLYQKRLQEADAMDFDDLLMQTVIMLEQNQDVLEYYQNRFHYIMVDEYQDTNMAQYRFIRLLAEGRRNLCVVGDDDQSIYKFRGATIENILSFEKQYPDAQVIRLEENYRSTQCILDAANAVIQNNSERKGKKLWTRNGQGDKIDLYDADNEMEEAKFIADKILDSVSAGRKYADHAVLYRLNAQASALERAMVKSGVPYRILAGLRFYEHKEIKDVIAYLSIINNPNDDLRLRRIINEPKRQIGDATMGTASQIAEGLGLSLYEVVKTADQYEPLMRSAPRLMAFAAMMEQLSEAAETLSLHELYERVLDQTGYMRMLEGQGQEALSRIENLNEFSSTILSYENENEDPSLAGFLEEISLMTDVDNYDQSADAVVLMTLHSAKGLEFPVVFIPGMEEGVFPGSQSVYSPDLVEEERRLCYVGITRAREKLILSRCRSRMLYGSTTRSKGSRFVEEIPEQYLDVLRPRKPVQEWTKKPNEKLLHRQVTTAAAHKVGTGSGTAGKPSASFQPGDQVSHKTFGTGMVVGATPMGNDTLLEIAFDKVGTKKLMANFARLKKA